MTSQTILAHRFGAGSSQVGDRWGEAFLVKAHAHSGMAASIFTGKVHLIDAAAIALSPDVPGRMAARWMCGGGSANVRPVDPSEVACERCEYVSHLPARLGIYRLYGEADELLYIGSSVNVRQRILGHRGANRPWWREVVRSTCEPHDTLEAAQLAEALAIRSEVPVYNRHNMPLRVTNGGRSA